MGQMVIYHNNTCKFRVGPTTEEYRLTISGFSGVIDDLFKSHNLDGMKFTTKDRDNDVMMNENCAVNQGGVRNAGCQITFPSLPFACLNLVHMYSANHVYPVASLYNLYRRC